MLIIVKLLLKKEQCCILQSILITRSTNPPTLHVQQFHPRKHANMHICILPCGKHDWCVRNRSNRERGTIHACSLMPPRFIKYAPFTAQRPESLCIKKTTRTLMVVLFYSSVSQHEQHQDPETEAAKWNSAFIHFIIYTCAFPIEMCQNVFSVKGVQEWWRCKLSHCNRCNKMNKRVREIINKAQCVHANTVQRRGLIWQNKWHLCGWTMGV